MLAESARMPLSIVLLSTLINCNLTRQSPSLVRSQLVIAERMKLIQKSYYESTPLRARLLQH